MFVPVLQGGVSSFIGFLFLAFTDFQFIRKYFFGMYTAIVILGMFNGLCVLPVVLSLAGPILGTHAKAARSPRHGIRVPSMDKRSPTAVEMVPTSNNNREVALSVEGGSLKDLSLPSPKKLGAKSDSVDIVIS